VIDRVWGASVLPRELLRAFQHAGCVLWGAEAGDELAGFVLGFLGWREGLHLHSHMLAVVPDRQSAGAGFALKLAQRAQCLDEGVAEVRWTYDPLVARNARFNLVKLGATATALLPAQYGEMTDRVNRGDRSDRFEVRWQIGSDRTMRAIEGSLSAPRLGEPVLRATGHPESPEPAESRARPGPGALVQIPPDHSALRQSHPELGVRWRECSSNVFGRCFAAGLEATWFSREGCYVFEPGERAR
jgi:predicted GNAT superfamily acetyltransferase